MRGRSMATNEIPGEARQRLLRAAERHVDTPAVEVERHGAEAEDTTSTTTKAPASFATRASCSMGWITPVEVSLCVSSTALTGCSASVAATSSGRISRPTRSRRSAR